jgi:hypothetical protein
VIFAKRLLSLREKGIDQDVPIRIFAPTSDGVEWVCRYEIDWPDGHRERAIHGADSVQALLLALKMIGFDLYTSEAHKTGRLMWEAAGQGYGFPVPVNARDLLVGEDKRFEA